MSQPHPKSEAPSISAPSARHPSVSHQRRLLPLLRSSHHHRRPPSRLPFQDASLHCPARVVGPSIHPSFDIAANKDKPPPSWSPTPSCTTPRYRTTSNSSQQPVRPRTSKTHNTPPN